MTKAVKIIIKALSIIAGTLIFISASSMVTCIDVSFIQSPKLLELYKNVESSATALIPDEIKDFISELSTKVS